MRTIPMTDADTIRLFEHILIINGNEHRLYTHTKISVEQVDGIHKILGGNYEAQERPLHPEEERFKMYNACDNYLRCMSPADAYCPSNNFMAGYKTAKNIK